jgi:ornithine cyclodeaminase/alanine dehydrogenase-like protein (mu-crystallin family)
VPLYLTETEVGELLAPADVLGAVEACFRRLAAGEIENAPRRRTRFEDGSLAVMWAVDN